MSTLRNPARLRLGLALALAALAAPARAQDESGTTPPAGPNEAAYEALGHLVLMHEGRRKPLDTVARQEVKAITGRQTFEPVGPDGKPGAKWGPVSALFSWQHAPDFWDDQRFILAEYIPLRRAILSRPIASLLGRIADDAETSDALKSRVREIRDRQAEGPEGVATSDELKAIAKDPGLPDRLQDEVEAMAHRIDGHEKFLSPRELEEARLTLKGKEVDLRQWYMDIAIRSRPNLTTGVPPKQTPLEKKVGEVFNRLSRYQAIRGDHGIGMLGAEVSLDRMVPRPSNDTYVSYLAAARKKYDAFVEENKERLNLPLLDRVKRDMQDVKLVVLETPSGQEYPIDQFLAVLSDVPGAEFNPVERDALGTLAEFYSELQAEDRKPPGTDDDTDEMLRTWLASDADWASVDLILEADPEELAKAGYDSGHVAAFREAVTAAREAEAEEPGSLSLAQAEAVVASARDLAGEVNVYPNVAQVAREVHYNTFAPFYKAPEAYGLGFLMLGLCLMIGTVGGGTFGTIRKGLYGLGLAGLVSGIALEIYGFTMRVLISGWAPVTNLYETVIWVALIAAVIGLALELIYRRVYAAAAAAGVAMVCTIIAANAQSVLDPNIEALNPILRSNYWLTIHVITIVSSYAAFALALGLGLIGTWFYLTSPYRHDVRYGRLLRPLLAMPPVALLGSLAVYASSSGRLADSTTLVSLWGLDLTAVNALFFGGWLLIASAIVMAVMALSGALGELVARLSLRNQAGLAAGAGAAGESSESSADERLASVESAGGGTATIARPSVAEIKARVAAARGESGDGDLRDRAMRQRAEQVKPIASFVYRALQVGVLLVAAGTILGGVWADYSWGRFWGWDPKEVSALITLLVYLVPLHGRFAGWINSFGMVCASVFCFLSVLMAWYGVNFLLGVGLHSYGFAEGGNQGTVLLSSLVVCSLPSGAIWRRSLARRGVEKPRPAAMAS
ncbi:ABC transporter permease [Tautonia sociabilis]|uniref:ABC transporter permease n=1 Tax=Tautonia sociabilis TaxID=2080755 RepID=A0A432MFL7_9BACT|nr:cytochrome c biogenesis protein CcsA [Tautonia sociabilis]RUL84987.1 ABC transporter permease [Tautonia sociabilis]